MADLVGTRSVAIVTGAGSGMGAAVARRLSDEAFDVVCVDVDLEAAIRTAEDLRGATAVVADVRDPESLDRAFDLAGQQLDAVVHAAGITRFHELATMDLDEWRLLLDINLTGTFLVLQRAIRHLQARGRGSIVTFASIESFRQVEGHAAYASTKAAVRMLTEAAAAEAAPHGLRVNAVAPGVIATPMNARALGDEGWRRRMLAAIPSGEVGSPEDVAAVCAFLCSDDARYINGQCVVVDGGLLSGSVL
jgi:NAD(P)-dependent dehydrogenase (short-subunit alcohol dehydrogenase family)